MIDSIALADVVVDLRREQVTGRDGTRRDLRPRAFAVLRRLAEEAGDLVDKDALLSDCWPGVIVTEDSLTQCISEIRRVLGAEARDLIRTVPRRGYRLILPESAPAAPAESPEPAGAPARFWPSIAVLPFDEFAEGPGGYGALGAGFAEDVITELARNRSLTVIARQSAFAARAAGGTASDIARLLGVRYVLEGSIRRAGERMVVTARLVEGPSDGEVWAERYAFAAAEVFAVQDELVARIAGTLFSGLQSSAQAASLRQAPASLDVYALTFQAVAQMLQLTPAGVVAARTELENAVERDPDYPVARIALGFCLATDAGMAISGTVGPDRLPEAIAGIRTGIERDPAIPVGHRALSYALLLAGRHGEALIAAERCIALSPGDATSLAFLSLARTAVGAYDAALASIERAIGLSPLAPAFFQGIAAGPLYALDRFEEAVRLTTEASHRNPGYTMAHAMGAAAAIALGRRDEAQLRTAELLRQSPAFHIGLPRVAQAYGQDRAMTERLASHLRAAGLPDRAA
ncbi:winged helix-turn-helix domain-containing tetratricopeptide repeat protein [Methylobacterium sp. A54F]